MAFREVSVIQVKEALRRWMRGEGERPIAKGAGIARGTVRNYVTAALAAGVDRDGSEEQLTDEVIGQVVEVVRPSRPDGHGLTWRRLLAEEEQIKAWVDDGLTVTKIHILLSRKGIDVAARTLARFAVDRCGAGRKRVTVRVNDPDPGQELQVDFGRLGLIPDGERRRVCWALIFTCCYSRHQFVWPTFTQTTEDVIAGFEAAWYFFGGVFPVVIPDNMSTIVAKADAIEPRFNDAFLEYAQARGFVIDPARVATPTDKPKVERCVPYVRGNFFAGEDFADLADIRRRAETWCRQTAGMRIHGTTYLRPAEVFAAEEAPLLLPRPGQPFDVPIWSDPVVHRDFHVQVEKALYSVHYHLVGKTLRARADSTVVKLYASGSLVKVWPRKPPGGRSTDPADMPPGKDIYAMRDITRLASMARAEGDAIGAYADALLDTPLPWTKMRQVYRLLGLVKKWGASRVEAACEKALEAEAVNVNLISRMIERAAESAESGLPPEPIAIQGRFARDASEFTAIKEVSK